MLPQFLIKLATYSITLFGVVIFIINYLAFEVGRLWGRATIIPDSPPKASGTIIGSMLGLIVFVLALTLSHAGSRFEERRLGTVAEANAISTAWLRAGAVSHDKGKEIASQLRDYAKTRTAFVQAEAGSKDIPELNRRTAELQAAIWKNFTAITEERRDPLVSELMVALNETFDRATAERFAFFLPIPPQIMWLVLMFPIVSLAALGFHLGQRKDRELILPLIFILMLTSVVTLLLDLASPRVGTIRPSDIAYEWVILGLVGETTPASPVARP